MKSTMKFAAFGLGPLFDARVDGNYEQTDTGWIDRFGARIQALVLALACLLAWAHPASAACVYSEAAWLNAGNTTATIDTTGASAQGILIAVVTSYADTSTGTVTGTDALTGLTERHDAGNVVFVRILYKINPTASASYSVDTTAIYSTIQLLACSSSSVVSFDGENGNNASGNDEEVQPGSLTPASNGYLIVSGAISQTANDMTVDGNFTANVEAIPAASLSRGAGMSYYIQPTAAAENPTWSWTGNSLRAAVIASFAGTWSGGGGAPTCRRGLLLMGVGC